MRRPVIALASALLALALAPGAAVGVPPGDLDQSADFGASTYMFDNLSGVTQTVTPGHTGLLTHLELYCDPGFTVNINVAIGSASTSSTCTDVGWLDFYLVAPVVAGQQYTIAIDSGGTPVSLGESSSDYAGGAAATDGHAIGGMSDFAFKTYVVALAATSYSWSPAHVSAATSTAVTLTTQTAFEEMLPVEPVVEPGAAPAALPSDFYSMKLGELPSWFSPTAIHCSAQVVAGDCSVARYQSGIHPTGDGTAMTVIITIDGTASPAAADSGATGTASGQGCVSIIGPDERALDLCDPGHAALAVGAAAARTLPPTTSVGGSGQSNGQLGWLLPAALAMVVGLLLASKRTIERRRARRA